MRDGKAVALSFGMRIESKAWGPAADAPTFLPSDALSVEGLSVSAAPATAPRAKKHVQSQSRRKSDSIITSAPKAAPQAPVAQPAAVSRNPSQSTVKPLPQ